MKYVKTLGLAAVAAMALMAFFGASSASATVLCKTTITEGCVSSGQHYPAGTQIVATSTNTKLTAGSATVSCAHSEVKGKTSNTGSASETVFGPISTLTFTTCSSTVHVLNPGSLEVHHLNKTAEKPRQMGSLTSKNAAVTVNIFGVSCVYGTSAAGTNLGVITDNAGSNPSTTTVDIATTVERKEGGFLCPSTGVWEGTYTITSPHSLFIAKS
ncbi:MAG: hypothetical protein M3335_02580 [Actinomycetota bacterium]|nr:hypothetical protein [Actinomycetota bacterium]